MKSDFDWPSGFRGEEFYKSVDNGQLMPEAYLSYKLTNEPSAQVS